MIFPNIETEDVIQVNDKIRISASKSFADKSEAAITDVEIEAEAAAGFISVFDADSDNWYLDWEYSTDGNKVISVRVTTDGAPITKTLTIVAISVVDDKLFSSDAELIANEADILKWVPPGRNTFLNVHRRAQELILAFLDKEGYTDSDGNRLTKAAIIDIEEVNEWSKFMVLRLIFEGIKNQPDDVFSQKVQTYQSEEIFHRNRSILRLDSTGDGTASSGEQIRITSTRVVRV
jgi:hypothetical protein